MNPYGGEACLRSYTTTEPDACATNSQGSNMPDVEDWFPMPYDLRLAEGEVHVWRASLCLDATTLAHLKTHLEPAEITRAERFRFKRDYDHFVASRGILRELLGMYSGLNPAELGFDYGPQDKPALRSRGASESLEFNVSHSHGLAVYAFARDREVGIDVELLRTNVDAQDIAERYFSLDEIAELKALPPKLQTEGFFLCWTRKEAYVKARGGGLEIPLASFSVTLTPGRPERLECGDDCRWGLRSFQPDPRFVGAVVGKGEGWNIRRWEWKS